MARGTSTSSLRDRIKSQCGETLETNSFNDTEINSQLAQEQWDLANAYDWPFLVHRWDLSAGVGGRYLTLPTSDIRGVSATINWERPVLVETFFNRYYWRLKYGIAGAQYNYLNSDLLQAQDPIQRWQWATNVNESFNANQIEIWPMTITNQTLRFTGQRTVGDLTSATAADLDDQLLVLKVSARRLLMRESPLAPEIARRAEAHLVRLRAGYATEDQPIILGKPHRWPEDRGKFPVAVASAS